MTCIDRCVCIGRTFADLLAEATRRCIDIAALSADTGAGNQCTRCEPYLRECLRTGQTEFGDVLPLEPGPTPQRPPLPHEFGRVMMSWSGGKDSAMALHRLMKDPRYQVVGLLTTISYEHRRISHHGVREDLLMQQAESIGLPLRPLYFPGPSGGPPTMANFDAHMNEVLAELRDDDVYLVAHGDIHLQDLRDYRDDRLASVGMRGVYPLWQEDTKDLLESFESDGFRAAITCAEPIIGASFAGAAVDTSLIDTLPHGVDPCGENGEYHSFVYEGPIFKEPVRFERGEVVERDGRHYADLIPFPQHS